MTRRSIESLVCDASLVIGVQYRLPRMTRQIKELMSIKTTDVWEVIHVGRTASWALEYGGMAVVERNKGRITAISGNHSEKLKIAGRIELDQCFSAPQMGSTKKLHRPSDEGLFTIQEIYFLSSPRVW
jgi:hypothetical protein